MRIILAILCMGALSLAPVLSSNAYAADGGGADGKGKAACHCSDHKDCKGEGEKCSCSHCKENKECSCGKKSQDGKGHGGGQKEHKGKKKDETAKAG